MRNFPLQISVSTSGWTSYIINVQAIQSQLNPKLKSHHDLVLQWGQGQRPVLDSGYLNHERCGVCDWGGELVGEEVLITDHQHEEGEEALGWLGDWIWMTGGGAWDTKANTTSKTPEETHQFETNKAAYYIYDVNFFTASTVPFNRNINCCKIVQWVFWCASWTSLIQWSSKEPHKSPVMFRTDLKNQSKMPHQKLHAIRHLYSITDNSHSAMTVKAIERYGHHTYLSLNLDMDD